MRQSRSPAPKRRPYRLAVLLAAMCVPGLWACAGYGYSYSGSALNPGQSTLEDVRATMGTPALEWVNPDHSMQLSYPRGPSGFHSYMVYLDPAGRLQRIQNVMNLDSFYRIARGMTEEQVLRILGPPWPAWTNYFPARRELVWEWRFCNDSSQAARFDVVFDGDSHTVRTSFGQPEVGFIDGPPPCGR